MQKLTPKTESALELAESFSKDTIEWRRHLHSIPEIAFKEEKTADYVAGLLQQFGYRIKRGMAVTGVVADLGSIGPTIALRAELDGIAIAETTQVPYCSREGGLSHACGHDVNMACVLTAARILAELKPACKIRIIMQPASEIASDESMKSGAEKMIEEGVLEGVGAILGIHVDSTLRSGTLGIIKEPLQKRSENFRITLEPSKKIPDTRCIVIGAAIIGSIDEALSKSGLDTSCISITSLVADETGRSKATLAGSIDYKSRDMFSVIREVIKSACESACGSAHEGCCHFDIEFERGGSTSLDTRMVERLYEAGLKVLGEERVEPLKRKTWSEDFSVYSGHLPAAMALLGAQLPGPPRVHHTGGFDIDDSQIHLGAAVLAETVLSLLDDCAILDGTHQSVIDDEEK